MRAINETQQRHYPYNNQAKHQASRSDSTLIGTIRAAPRLVKVIVIITFCILSTAETVFWVQVGWRKFFGRSAERDEQEVEVPRNK